MSYQTMLVFSVLKILLFLDVWSWNSLCPRHNLLWNTQSSIAVPELSDGLRRRLFSSSLFSSHIMCVNDDSARASVVSQMLHLCAWMWRKGNGGVQGKSQSVDYTENKDESKTGEGSSEHCLSTFYNALTMYLRRGGFTDTDLMKQLNPVDTLPLICKNSSYLLDFHIATTNVIYWDFMLQINTM